MLPTLEVGPFVVSTYALLGNAGFALALALYWRLLRQDTALHQWIWLPTVALAIVFGTTGSRLWKLLRTSWESAPDGILDYFDYTAGSSWFGGFGSALFAITLFALLAGLPLLRILDTLAPCAALGQAFGRLGCFMAGDGCYGVYTDLPWGVAFPNGTIPIDVTVHPTPLYSAALLLALALLLTHSLRVQRERGRRHAGLVAAAYAGAISVTRFLMEYLRATDPVALGLTEAQIISAGLFAVGVAIAGVVAARTYRGPAPQPGALATSAG